MIYRVKSYEVSQKYMQIWLSLNSHNLPMQLSSYEFF